MFAPLGNCRPQGPARAARIRSTSRRTIGGNLVVTFAKQGAGQGG
jgi:hypothetical protein